MWFMLCDRNYPLLMATWKVAPALAAGCAAILKPSELASVYVKINFCNLYFFVMLVSYAVIPFAILGHVWSWLKYAEK